MSFRPAFLLAASLLLLSGCGSPPVEWGADRAFALGASTVTVTPAGDTTSDTLAARLASLTLPTATCPGSLRAAQLGGTLVAVWWAVRPDSSARLVAARTHDAGATWSTVTPVDTLDRGVIGCRRAPASIAADP